jgi:hypothetical protein
VLAAPVPSRDDSAAAAEAAATAALQAAEEAKASAAELGRQLAANEAARLEAERQRDEAEAKLAVMAQVASEAAAAEAAAAEEAAAEAAVKALRLAEATAAAAAATDASRVAAAAATQAGAASGDGAAAGEGDGEQGQPEVVVVTDPFAELPPLPPRPEVSPGSLVMRAIQSGAEAGEEWAAQFAAMLRQAEQDASAFQGELQHREEQFGARLGAIRDEAMARISAARLAARQASVHAERLRMAVDASQAAYLAASQRLDDAIRVRAQRSAARVAAETALTEASAVVTARLLRLEALDAQRQRLNVLSAAFAARDRARDEESSAHALAVALMAFEAALQEGQPLTEHVQRILGACISRGVTQRSACRAHVCSDPIPSPIGCSRIKERPLPGGCARVRPAGCAATSRAAGDSGGRGPPRPPACTCAHHRPCGRPLPPSLHRGVHPAHTRAPRRAGGTAAGRRRRGVPGEGNRPSEGGTIAGRGPGAGRPPRW